MSSKPRVFYVNHSEKQCGVYQFGKNIGTALATSTKFDFRYLECSDAASLNGHLAQDQPLAVVYNFHPDTLGWAKWNSLAVRVPQIAMVHEIYQQVADVLTNYTFDYYIGADPTLLLKNPVVFKTGRLVPEYHNSLPLPAVPTIGSFGFGTPGKGFEEIVRRVQEEFDEAVIRFNIPFARFGDLDGERARQIAANCRALIRKPGVILEVGHDFFDDDQLLHFLSQNTINVFLYEQNKARGISSVIEYALAVNRAIAVSESSMFRHIRDASPSIVLPRSSLRRIISNGVEPLQKFKAEFTKANLIWEYERILQTVLRGEPPRNAIDKIAHIFLSKTIYRNRRPNYFSWAAHERSGGRIIARQPRASFVGVPSGSSSSYNRILDDSARVLYQPVVDQLWKFVPSIMRNKIPEANVQQAFVLDTAIKLAANYSSPRILAVGSYEDSAVAALKSLGYDVTETDPVLNYDLHTFLTKPTSLGRKFDLVVSTSVIEHVPDDVQFCRDIASVLEVGGCAIITCDYNDQYRPGDDIPAVDCRWYTQSDIKNRLLKSVPDCRLYDEPRWDCPDPDFVLVNRYRYTFASIVLRKVGSSDDARGSLPADAAA